MYRKDETRLHEMCMSLVRYKDDCPRTADEVILDAQALLHIGVEIYEAMSRGQSIKSQIDAAAEIAAMYYGARIFMDRDKNGNDLPRHKWKWVQRPARNLRQLAMHHDFIFTHEPWPNPDTGKMYWEQISEDERQVITLCMNLSREHKAHTRGHEGVIEDARELIREGKLAQKAVARGQSPKAAIRRAKQIAEFYPLNVHTDAHRAGLILAVSSQRHCPMFGGDDIFKLAVLDLADKSEAA